MNHLRLTTTPVGCLTLTARSGLLTRIAWTESSGTETPEDATDTRALLQRTARQLDEYFRGRRHVFDLALSLPGTTLSQEVWRALLQIPYGQTTSYAALAATVGRPTAVRAVARACATNPLPLVIPCHRVIGTDGSLRGFLGGLPAKRWLLQHERANRAFASAVL